MRIGLAIACMGICAALLAVLWPHARDAGAILAAQDDPAVLSDLRLNSALRNDQAVIAGNIEAALAKTTPISPTALSNSPGRGTSRLAKTSRGGWPMPSRKQIRRRILQNASPQVS
jgi:hypothetical protein